MFEVKPSSAIRAKIVDAIDRLDPMMRHPLTRQVCAILALTQDEDCDAYRALMRRLNAWRHGAIQQGASPDEVVGLEESLLEEMRSQEN